MLAVTACERQVEIIDGDDPSSMIASVPQQDSLPIPNPGVPPSNMPVAPDVSTSPDTPTVPPAPISTPTTIVSDDSQVSIGLVRPFMLDDTAGIGDIVPVLQNIDGSLIPLMCCDDNGGYFAAVPLNLEQQWSGKILWRTSGIDPIVVLESQIEVLAENSGTLNITPAFYNRDIDTDGDGVTNIAELVLGTDPLDATDASTDFLSATVRIPRVEMNQVPIIDGNAGSYATGTTRFIGEWENAVQVDVAGNRLSIGNLMFTAPDVERGSENHHWAAMHDGTWLYLLVVIDDSGLHHFDTQDPRKPWRDDSIELFIDGNNSQSSMYDQVDDFSAHIVLLDTAEGGVNSSSNASPKVFRSVNSVPLPAGVVFTTGPGKGPTAPATANSIAAPQDVYEIAMRISDLNIVPGRTFGFEVQFDDDDDAGDRDAKWGWQHPAGNSADNDFTWQDPSFMGRVVLSP